MCGIFGYVGAPVRVGGVVLEALQSMEYRGYDSWGVAYSLSGTPGSILKGVGRVAVDAAAEAEATSAIGHTRWATHGEVCERNAHPHVGCGDQIALVHNGIIENADALRKELGISHAFHSETDSELMAHLLDHLVTVKPTLTEAVDAAFHLIEGNNAFVVLDRETEEVVVVTRRLPIRLSDVQGALVLASDPAALSGVANTTISVPDNCAVSLGTPAQPSSAVLRLFAEGQASPVPVRSKHNGTGPGAAMRFEVAEQPDVLVRLAGDWSPLRAAFEVVSNARRVVFTGCGSAFHAASFAANRLNQCQSAIEAVAWPASEVQGQPGMIRSTDVFVALTQSGETADVIDAVTVARERGAHTVGLINAEGSSVERLVDVVVPLRAGHERSVLATKSFMAMLARVWQLVEMVGDQNRQGDRSALHQEAEMLRSALLDAQTRSWVTELSQALACRSSAMVVASGIHTPIANEAALKIKEGSYVHAESVRAGELKHGVIALVDEGFPCLLMASEHDVSGRLRIAAEELRSRGAAVFWCGPNPPNGIGSESGNRILQSSSAFVQTMLAQLVALETALLRGADPDYPRNLAKSVTVR